MPTYTSTSTLVDDSSSSSSMLQQGQSMMFASDERSKTYNDHGNSERSASHNNANPKKSLKLSLPTPPSPNEILDQSIGNDADDIDSGEAEGWFWYLGKRVRVRKPGKKEYFVEKDVDDLVEEEYDCGYLNLGAESPHSTGSISPFSFNEDRPPANWKPGPSASARRGSVNAGSGGNNNSNNGGNQKKKTSGPDRDCGICFEYAVKPLRTLCCGKIFCEQDLRDWLHGPNASGLCPNCDVPCTLEDNTLSLVSPSLRSPPPPPRKRSQQFDRTMSGQRHVPSPLSTSEPITHHRKRSSSPKGLGISTEKPAQQTSPLSEKQTLSSSPLSPLSAAHWSLPSASTTTTTTTTTTSHSHSTSKSTNPLTILTSSLPLGLAPAKSTHGSTTPSMWNNGKVFSKGGKVPKGSVIDSFLTERKEDQYGMLVRLLTLIAVLGVLYVIMG
ncbi:hypothetical protein CC2G_002014 [Coprinopsis cinerea AmutBmut pab1-1]|nr:hypothetical protein CC2G_002014 [Coprinopsis cinerea AmutBmut pab1-1]